MLGGVRGSPGWSESVFTTESSIVAYRGIVKRGARPLQGVRSLSFLGGRDE